jgi:alcohol dehydrogenase class IV
MPAIERFVNDPDPKSARAMCIGSHYAGRAINISRTSAAHALSYGITKTYGVSHGHAVALTLGAFVEAHAAADIAVLRPGIAPDVHAAAMASILDALDARDGSHARWQLNRLMERIGLDSRLSAAGVSGAEERAALAETVNAERLGNNPVPFDQAQLTDLLRTE